MSSKNTKVVIPTQKGEDLESKNGEKDAHISRSTYKFIADAIYIDVFDSTIENPDMAHIKSESFPCTGGGARTATDFLKGHGFDVTVQLK